MGRFSPRRHGVHGEELRKKNLIHHRNAEIVEKE